MSYNVKLKTSWTFKPADKIKARGQQHYCIAHSVGSPLLTFVVLAVLLGVFPLRLRCAALRVAIDIETPIVFLYLLQRAAQRSRSGNGPLGHVKNS